MTSLRASPKRAKRLALAALVFAVALSVISVFAGPRRRFHEAAHARATALLTAVVGEGAIEKGVVSIPAEALPLPSRGRLWLKKDWRDFLCLIRRGDVSWLLAGRLVYQKADQETLRAARLTREQADLVWATVGYLERIQAAFARKTYGSDAVQISGARYGFRKTHGRDMYFPEDICQRLRTICVERFLDEIAAGAWGFSDKAEVLLPATECIVRESVPWTTGNDTATLVAFGSIYARLAGKEALPILNRALALKKPPWSETLLKHIPVLKDTLRKREMQGSWETRLPYGFPEKELWFIENIDGRSADECFSSIEAVMGDMDSFWLCEDALAYAAARWPDEFAKWVAKWPRKTGWFDNRLVADALAVPSAFEPIARWSLECPDWNSHAEFYDWLWTEGEGRVLPGDLRGLVEAHSSEGFEYHRTRIAALKTLVARYGDTRAIDTLKAEVQKPLEGAGSYFYTYQWLAAEALVELAKRCELVGDVDGPLREAVVRFARQESRLPEPDVGWQTYAHWDLTAPSPLCARIGDLVADHSGDENLRVLLDVMFGRGVLREAYADNPALGEAVRYHYSHDLCWGATREIPHRAEILRTWLESEYSEELILGGDSHGLCWGIAADTDLRVLLQPLKKAIDRLSAADESEIARLEYAYDGFLESPVGYVSALEVALELERAPDLAAFQRTLDENRMDLVESFGGAVLRNRFDQARLREMLADENYTSLHALICDGILQEIEGW
ncbi:MAG: hypothetical protein ACYTAN_15515 [Planctomycetota bacterium]|jgi:hypothetical protein